MPSRGRSRAEMKKLEGNMKVSVIMGCKQCQGDVSTSAVHCPHCGAKLKTLEEALTSLKERNSPGERALNR
jgi:hypothetical protein